MVRFSTKPDAENVFVGLTSKNGAFFPVQEKKNDVTTINYIPNIKPLLFTD
jgi:hypothetical protein